jgi:hypothetical protein
MEGEGCEMNHEQFSNEVIVPALWELARIDRRFSDNKIRTLLLGTAAVESGFVHLRQIGGGPALSYFQIEPDTAKWLLGEYLPRRQPKMHSVIRDRLNGRAITDALVEDQIFAAMLCRMRYWAVPAAVPDTLLGQAAYWKQWYNTQGGAGTAAKYAETYNRLIGDFDLGVGQ